jgi:hypothetical protein
MHELGIGFTLVFKGFQEDLRCFVANGIVSALWSPSSGHHPSSGDLYLDTDDYTVVSPVFNNPLLDVQAAVEGLSRLGFVTQYLRFQSLFDTTTTTYTGSLYDSASSTRNIYIKVIRASPTFCM